MITTIKNAFKQFNQADSFDKTECDASVLLAISDEAHPKILFCKRAQNLSSHPGEISFPGGKREQPDTDNISVALRETFEETGIQPTDVTVIAELTEQQTKNGLKVKPIVGIVPANVQLTPEVAEVDKLFWVSLTEFNSNNIQPYEVTFKNYTFKTPSFQVGNEIIWGLTGRILADFINQSFNESISWPIVLTK